jgi:hypothetical protein
MSHHGRWLDPCSTTGCSYRVSIGSSQILSSRTYSPTQSYSLMGLVAEALKLSSGSQTCALQTTPGALYGSESHFQTLCLSYCIK